jgi:hypothetical protein
MKYQLILRNVTTFEDKTICKFHPKWIYTVFIFFVAAIMSLSFWMFNTVFSKWVNPLHYYNISSENFYKMAETIQELETHAKQHEQYIEMLQSVINGEDLKQNTIQKTEIHEIKNLGSNEDSFCSEVDDCSAIYSSQIVSPETHNQKIAPPKAQMNHSKDRFRESNIKKNSDSDFDIVFFPPSNGNIVAHYKEKSNSYKNGITMNSLKHSPICCVTDGTIVFSDFVENQNRYITIVQHRNSIVSVYRHKNKSFKPSGSVLSAGDIITIVNDDVNGENYNFSFELWIDCEHVDPEDYIVF